VKATQATLPPGYKIVRIDDQTGQLATPKGTADALPTDPITAEVQGLFEKYDLVHTPRRLSHALLRLPTLFLP
jgi:hypothetical protein